ncbi:MAG TPA: efflux RND transporter periplasmic adaptor subunit, partial [Phaeodactylibacter sp.]|nr:efflux RND transporter periplasmic adaptor subunit [Phaeodactylibacter sp.]
KTAMLVDVESAQSGAYQPNIIATGTVQPAQDIMLSPRVQGQIVRRSPAFIPGGFVKKGQLLLQIDPADYQNTLRLRESELAQARADLRIEQGQQNVARQDYEMLGDTLPEARKALVLRQPQLQSVRARVEAAETAVEQAKLNLERSSIRAPFDAHILTRMANVGSQVAPGDRLGRLVGSDMYWVMATVPASKLRWLEFPQRDGQRGSKVMLHDRSAWPEGSYREGYLYKLMGTLEGQTRMARVIVAVPNPLDKAQEQLMIGAFMEAHIQGQVLPPTVRLERDYLREDETVWVMAGDSLDIREVDILLQDADYAYIQEGLSPGDRIVTTNLSTVTEGAKLRLEGQSQPASDSTDPVSQHSPQSQLQ